MIFTYLLFWCTLFQVSSWKITHIQEEGQVLLLELEAEKDTFLYSESLLLTARVKNIGKQPVYLPIDFSVVSNLLPNGASGTIFNGGVIQFRVQPISTSSVLYTENLIRIEPRDFIKLPPQQSYDFKYDLNIHFMKINRFLSEDDSLLPIESGKTYQIQASYENSWNHKKRVKNNFKGKLHSKPITIYLKEE
ncbi:hypothetical protein GXP67_35280 [Rhodocytophaga rosea]|uniref:Uncharacterized protein n=1 Tax=Rhodocytophaga rosea TaxID=2704465 RepID=A0A6C0GU39_9BACT|nr:hypothetical protein [Rhodocytophaga rosea]QHT71556.1 hypothetical protein GXP67_35280 [Rhodocytophaga rosea]